ncbi:hypothetical protein [Paenibacillus sp. TY11]|uniref:hypothetical protein n=1 Tax=Paenibacillus sp. TY11 TaxID=3448633 RepID=UPI004039CBC1
MSAWISQFYNRYKYTNYCRQSYGGFFALILRGGFICRWQQATRERLTSSVTTLHYPLDYYFGLFLRDKGLEPRTLNDHKNHYRYLQRWLAENHPTLKLNELTADHVRQYVGHMLTEQTLYDGHPTLESHNTTKGLSPATMNVRTRTLKRTFDKKGFPLETVVSPRIILPAEIIENSCDTSGDMLFRPRDLSERALLELFIEAKGKGVFRTGFLNDLREMLK